jgi:DNA-binding transcriptional ArsR family regulator
VRIVKHVLDHSLDRVFHALSDPTRRHILERLSRGPASVGDLAAPLDMTLAAVVQHVQVLEASGVVRTEKVGRVRMCRVEPAALTAAAKWFTARRVAWEQNLDRLEQVLRESTDDPDDDDPGKKKRTKRSRR